LFLFNITREQLFKNIQAAPLKLPVFLSTEVKQLIIALLNRNPKKRLGAGKSDADEIKKHPWFKSINWQDVLEMKLKPPKPFIKELKPASFPEDFFVETSVDHHRVDGWSYKSKNAL